MNIKFHWLTWSGGSKIHRSAKFSQNPSVLCGNIVIFHNGRCCHLAFYKNRNCKILLADGFWTAKMHHHAIFCHIPSIHLQSYCIFFIFHDGGHCHLDFRNSQLIGCRGPKGQDALSCQISSKSVNPLKRYHDFVISEDGGCRHLGFLKFSIFIGRCSLGSRCFTVPNFVKIG